MSESKSKRRDGKDRYRVRSWKAKLVLMVLPVVLLVIGLELSARAYVWVKYGSHDHGMNWKFAYEPYLETRHDERMHKEFPPKGDKFRVVLLGGSTASLVPDDDLARAFEEQLGLEVEVINLGQAAYIANQERIMFLLHGMRLDPDMVITLNGANDLVTASKTGRPGITYADGFIALGVEKPVLNGLLGIVRNSQLINCVNKLRERVVEKKAHQDNGLMAQTVDHFLEALGTISFMAKGMEIPHVMVLQPYVRLRENATESELALAEVYSYRGDYMGGGFKDLRKKMKDRAFPGEVHFVDATQAFNGVEGDCFIDEVHLTERGNKALSEFIAHSLRNSGFRVPGAISSAGN